MTQLQAEDPYNIISESKPYVSPQKLENARPHSSGSIENVTPL